MDIVLLGAFADDKTASHARGISISVEQFAILDDGRRIVLDDQRGFSGSTFRTGHPGPIDSWPFMTHDSVVADVLNTVLPDDDDGEAHPWVWLAELLREHGVHVLPERLKELPYDVVLSDRLIARLTPGPRDPRLDNDD